MLIKDPGATSVSRQQCYRRLEVAHINEQDLLYDDIELVRVRCIEVELNRHSWRKI